MKEIGILIDEPKQCVHPKIVLLWQKVCVKRHQHQFTVVRINWKFQITFAWRPWYDAIQIPIDLPKMTILQKKLSFQMKLILILSGMKRSKIVAFEAKKTPTHSLKSRYTPKQVTVWCGYWFRGIISHFSSKISKGWPLQSVAIEIGKNWREEYWQHLVSTRRRYVPHSRSYARYFAHCFSRSHY